MLFSQFCCTAARRAQWPCISQLDSMHSTLHV